MKEGDIVEILKVCKRRECEICGEPATHRLTFLLKGARSNPQSRAYGRDDCSRCSDEDMFTCDKHAQDKYIYAKEKDMEWCSDFGYTRFEHMFLYWEENSTEKING